MSWTEQVMERLPDANEAIDGFADRRDALMEQFDEVLERTGEVHAPTVAYEIVRPLWDAAPLEMRQMWPFLIKGLADAWIAHDDQRNDRAMGMGGQ